MSLPVGRARGQGPSTLRPQPPAPSPQESGRPEPGLSHQTAATRSSPARLGPASPVLPHGNLRSEASSATAPALTLRSSTNRHGRLILKTLPFGLNMKESQPQKAWEKRPVTVSQPQASLTPWQGGELCQSGYVHAANSGGRYRVRVAAMEHSGRGPGSCGAASSWRGCHQPCKLSLPPRTRLPPWEQDQGEVKPLRTGPSLRAAKGFWGQRPHLAGPHHLPAATGPSWGAPRPG